MQTLAILHILQNHRDMKPEVYTLPAELDQRVAALKIRAMGIAIDELSSEQKQYLHGK
jgi:adenosylhomocysteinase